MNNILITGGEGYIARNLNILFKNTKKYNIFNPSHSQLDLLNYDQLIKYIFKNKINYIIHAAIKGGNRFKKDIFDEVYVPNILMFENIIKILKNYDIIQKVIIFGSGAEFDRRNDIKYENEENIFIKYPIDAYGLSKNIISRRSLSHHMNIYILRLFGCFNHDDKINRFITSSILALKSGIPIRINKNIEMDYFYLDDILPIIEYIFEGKYYIPRNINLVYKEKYNLKDIANIICKTWNLFQDKTFQDNNIQVINNDCGLSYSGNGSELSKLFFYNKLRGLENGIKETVEFFVNI